MSDYRQPDGQVPPGYEVVEHTADWAIRVVGSDLKELFHNAALGMESLLAAELSSIEPTVERHVDLEAGDVETLLVDWLSELAYWAESESLVFTLIDLIEVSEHRLRAAVRGGAVRELLKHIKAVTYHDLRVSRTASGFEATVVFDV